MAKTFLQGLFGDDEETPVEQPLPVGIEPQSEPFKIQNPNVAEWAKKMYGDKFSDDARQKLLDERKSEESGLDVSGALASLGDSWSGGSGDAEAFNKDRNARRARPLEEFDAGRKATAIDTEMGMKLRDDSMSQDILARENDPNSEESKGAQALAAKLGVSPERAAKLTAAQWKAQGPMYEKMYEATQRSMDRSDARQARNEELSLKREDRLAAREEGAGKRAYENLPEEKKQTISGLAKKNVDKESIVNSIDAVMNSWDKWSEDERLQQGKQLIKVLNSTQGADAVGVEESKRLASKLQFALGNFTNDSPVQFGRDLEGFKQDAVNTSQSIKDSVAANNKLIDQAYGRKPGIYAQGDEASIQRQKRIAELKEKREKTYVSK